MDETNEDSWLYGTSNPDSTTNETQGDEAKTIAAGVENQANTAQLSELKSEVENEAQALAAVQNASSEMMMNAKQEQHDVVEESYGDYEDPAQEMEEDEEATAAASRAADTTEGEGANDIGAVSDEEEQQQQQTLKTNTASDVDDEDDSDDDDINVVIDIKSAPGSYNIKQRGNLLAAGQAGQEKSKTTAQGGKFSIEDFEGVGSINGVAAHEFSIDSLEDKPWRKPGADITDYFNYGFNEETWRAYCERQKRFRLNESGVGLASLTQNLNQADRHTEHGMGLLPPPGGMAPPGMMMHDPMQGGQSAMMPPPMGAHHHGGQIQRMPMRPRQINNSANNNNIKENAIQVMTAECREYSRPGQMVSNFAGPPPSDEPFFPEADPFNYGYEPTQESQWGNNDNSGWVPTGIKELTPGPALVQQPPMSVPPGVPPPGPMGMPPGQQMGGPPMGPPIRGPIMNNMPPNMGMGPPPPHVMMMGPGGPGGPMGPMPPMGPRMMPPQQQQQHGGPSQMGPNKDHPDDRSRSPSRRNRSRSPHRPRRRSKSPSLRQRRSRSRSKSRKPRTSRRSRSTSKTRKTNIRSTRRSRSRSGSKTRKTSRTQRSPSESKSRSKRSRKSHSRSRSKSPKTATPSSSIKKRIEKIEK